MPARGLPVGRDPTAGRSARTAGGSTSARPEFPGRRATTYLYAATVIHRCEPCCSLTPEHIPAKDVTLPEIETTIQFSEEQNILVQTIALQALLRLLR